jgi:N-acetylglucosaminyl-diphospho-decaprenol L-rhamnosyltransferase
LIHLRRAPALDNSRFRFIALTAFLMSTPAAQRPQDFGVLISIVNYRTAALAVECLRSLQADVLARGRTHVVVVDNASGDDSVARIQAAIEHEGWGTWARVVASPRNGGFAAGNNDAVRAARAAGIAFDLVWLINPDARVRPGALARLCTFMAEHPRAGIAGGSMENGQGERWPLAFRFPSALGEFEAGMHLGLVSRLLARHAVGRVMGDEACRADWICGANFMIRAVTIEQIGLMDEGYFLYYEETDYCREAHKAGWECWYVPDARVLHIAGQSTGVTAADGFTRRIPAYWFESRRRYYVKQHGRVYAALVDAAWLASHGLWRLRCLLSGKQRQDPPYLFRDFVAHSVWRNPQASAAVERFE